MFAPNAKWKQLTHTKIGLRQIWSLHLSSYLCNEGRLTSSYGQQVEMNTIAQQKRKGN